MKTKLNKSFNWFKVTATIETSGSWSGPKSLINTNFLTIESALSAMHEAGYALRESNWEIYGYRYFGLLKCRVMLSDIYNDGYLYGKIDDRLGGYYTYMNDFIS